jgi:hypothetical protein
MYPNREDGRIGYGCGGVYPGTRRVRVDPSGTRVYPRVYPGTQQLIACWEKRRPGGSMAPPQAEPMDASGPSAGAVSGGGEGDGQALEPFPLPASSRSEEATEEKRRRSRGAATRRVRASLAADTEQRRSASVRGATRSVRGVPQRASSALSPLPRSIAVAATLSAAARAHTLAPS